MVISYQLDPSSVWCLQHHSTYVAVCAPIVMWGLWEWQGLSLGSGAPGHVACRGHVLHACFSRVWPDQSPSGNAVGTALLPVFPSGSQHWTLSQYNCASSHGGGEDSWWWEAAAFQGPPEAAAGVAAPHRSPQL